MAHPLEARVPRVAVFRKFARRCSRAQAGVALAIVVWAVAGCATNYRPLSSAAVHKGLSGRIAGYGIYTIDGAGRLNIVPGAPGGFNMSYSNFPVYIKQTHTIPALKNTQFGFTYEITGLVPNKPVHLLHRTSYPPMHPPGERESRSFSRLGTRKADREGRLRGFIGYSLVQPYEMLPGEWKMEVLVGGMPAFEEIFHVTNTRDSPRGGMK